MWLARFFVGGRWYQQILWKMPPTFTDNPDGSGGLGYWMGEMVKYAAFKPHASLVNRNDADARSAQAWQRLRDGGKRT